MCAQSRQVRARMTHLYETAIVACRPVAVIGRFDAPTAGSRLEQSPKAGPLLARQANPIDFEYKLDFRTERLDVAKRHV